MNWFFLRPDERGPARTIRHLGGRFTLSRTWPFCAHIISLWLRETSIQDDDFLAFGELPMLEAAELGYTQLRDRGIAKLTQFPSLKYVFLWGTAITDASLETLSSMNCLRLVNLSQTGITYEGINSLRDQLPDCLISHSEFGVYFRDVVGTKAYGAWVDRD